MYTPPNFVVRLFWLGGAQARCLPIRASVMLLLTVVVAAACSGCESCCFLRKYVGRVCLRWAWSIGAFVIVILCNHTLFTCHLVYMVYYV